jgi:integrase
VHLAVLRQKLGTRKAALVTTTMIADIHAEKHGEQYQANRLLATVSSLYIWAAQNGHVPNGTNPAKGVQKYKEQARQRFLTDDELERLGEALRIGEEGKLRGPQNATFFDPLCISAIRLLILTGARLNEILKLRWDWIDFDRAIIFLPDSKTGQKPLYLSGAAIEVFKKLPRKSAFVFPGRTPERPRNDLQPAWNAVRNAAGLQGVRLHDLRHSFASVGVGNSLGLPIIGKLLGHSAASTTQRYAHLASGPMHAAADLIGQRIAAAINGQKGDGQ